MIADYSLGQVGAGSMTADQALQLAEKQFADLLPDGVETAGHHLLIPETDGDAVGILWIHLADGTDSPTAFIYDFMVDEALRGRGIGRQIMLAGEEYARERGAASMRLHVFGSNAVARHLYRSLGYDETNVAMAKPLGGAAR